MSAPSLRAQIGVLDPDQDTASTLSEWLRAAGYSPQLVEDVRGPLAACLVRWPTTVSLARTACPIVLMADRGASLSEDVTSQVAEVVVLPDSSDMKSLLAWSAQLTAVLRQITTPKAEACRVQGLRLAGEELRRPVPKVIALGISTGGPIALQELFVSMRGLSLPPMAIVQHIPTNFLVPLIERLAQYSGYRFEVAREGLVLQPGVAYFAPGEHHLRLAEERGVLQAHLTDEPARRGHRPAAEILFESCATLAMRGVGVLMTGMGQDGAQALLQLRRRGWATIGQSEATCAIYGMPRAAKQIGAIEREVALADIGGWLAMLCRPRKPQSA